MLKGLSRLIVPRKKHILLRFSGTEQEKEEEKVEEEKGRGARFN